MKIIADLGLASNKVTAAQEGYLERYRNHPGHMLDVSRSVDAWLNLSLTVSVQAVSESNTEATQSISGGRLRTANQRRDHESRGLEGN